MTASSSTPVEPQAIPAGRRAAGSVRVPPSKSLTHRYLNLALLARRAVAIERPLLAEDTRLFLAALAACGWRVEHRDGEVALAPPAGLGGAPAPEVEIFCGNAGTMLRFLIASLTALPGCWRLDGVARLRERPVAPLVAALRGLGAGIRSTGRDGGLPLAIAGGTLAGGSTRLDAGDSSQFLSALLMAGLAAPAPVRVEVSSLTSAPYVEVTLAAVREFGGTIETEAAHAVSAAMPAMPAMRSTPAMPAMRSTLAMAEMPGSTASRVYRVLPGMRPPPRLRIEGDASAACYPAAAAALTGGSVAVEGVSAGSAQGDRQFLELLAAMGAGVVWHGDRVEVTGAGALQAVTADLSAMPDQVPTLAALAPFARGTTRIRNVAHLRLKESDRLAAMARELRRLGAEVEEGPDRLDIPGCWADAAPPENVVEVETHDDHRIAMSLALAGLRRPGVVVRSPQVVAKSYPGFWVDFLGLLG